MRAPDRIAGGARRRSVVVVRRCAHDGGNFHFRLLFTRPGDLCAMCSCAIVSASVQQLIYTIHHDDNDDDDNLNVSSSAELVCSLILLYTYDNVTTAHTQTTNVSFNVAVDSNYNCINCGRCPVRIDQSSCSLVVGLRLWRDVRTCSDCVTFRGLRSVRLSVNLCAQRGDVRSVISMSNRLAARTSRRYRLAQRSQCNTERHSGQP